MPFSSALISNSRARRNLSTSNPPSLKAFPDVWEAIVRAICVLACFLFRPDSSGCVDAFRLGAMLPLPIPQVNRLVSHQRHVVFLLDARCNLRTLWHRGEVIIRVLGAVQVATVIFLGIG